MDLFIWKANFKLTKSKVSRISAASFLLDFDRWTGLKWKWTAVFPCNIDRARLVLISERTKHNKIYISFDKINCILDAEVFSQLIYYLSSLDGDSLCEKRHVVCNLNIETMLQKCTNEHMVSLNVCYINDRNSELSINCSRGY